MGGLLHTIKTTLPAVALGVFQILSGNTYAQRVPFPSGSGVIEGDAATVGAIIMGGYAQNGSRPGTVATGKTNSSSATWTSPSFLNTPPGTMCGSHTQGSRANDWRITYCQGYDPRVSCPVSFTRTIYGEADYVYFYTCVKN